MSTRVALIDGCIYFRSEVDGQHYNGYIVTYPSIWVHTLDRL